MSLRQARTDTSVRTRSRNPSLLKDEIQHQLCRYHISREKLWSSNYCCTRDMGTTRHPQQQGTLRRVRVCACACGYTKQNKKQKTKNARMYLVEAHYCCRTKRSSYSFRTMINKHLSYVRAAVAGRHAVCELEAGSPQRTESTVVGRCTCVSSERCKQTTQRHQRGNVHGGRRGTRQVNRGTVRTIEEGRRQREEEHLDKEGFLTFGDTAVDY